MDLLPEEIKRREELTLKLLRSSGVPQGKEFDNFVEWVANPNNTLPKYNFEILDDYSTLKGILNSAARKEEIENLIIDAKKDPSHKNEPYDIIYFGKGGIDDDLSRFDGPALIHPSREELFWYQNGKLHRDNDEPAIDSSYSRAWYQNGKRHRDNDKPAIIDFEQQEWYKNGILHRDNDQPAIIRRDNLGYFWYQNGKLHRDGDKPAIITGLEQKWYQNGKLHRDGDKPAIVVSIPGSSALFEQYWYQNGVIHRDNDKPAIVELNQRFWYQNGKLHRDGDKPALVSLLVEEWYKNGKLHRDGKKPAVKDIYGNNEFWINGIKQ